MQMNAISVETPREINLSSLSLEGKLEIKNLGRPITEINITKNHKSVIYMFCMLQVLSLLGPKRYRITQI